MSGFIGLDCTEKVYKYFLSYNQVCCMLYAIHYSTRVCTKS